MLNKKYELYEAKAQILKALAHPTRLWITEHLGEREYCVCEFVAALDAEFSTISRHLTILKQAGIVESSKRGKQVIYRLKVPCVLNFIHCVQTVLVNQAAEQAALLQQ